MKFNVTAEENEVEIIDKAAAKVRRSRSSFMVVASLEEAKKILEEGDSNE